MSQLISDLICVTPIIPVYRCSCGTAPLPVGGYYVALLNLHCDFFADDQIIKQGCLIKSPPSYVFNKKGSWKARLLKLCQTSQGSFVLRYYGYDGVTEHWKGDILISNIKSIELGKNLKEKILPITRLFNNSADNILCIRTEGRDYYLVDDSIENIAEWQKYITDAWEKVHHKVTIGEPTNPCTKLLEFVQEQQYMQEQQKEATRLCSYPEDRLHTGPALDAIGEPTNPCANLLEFPQEQQYMQDKEVMRPFSYPEDRLHTGPALDAESSRQRSLTDSETSRRTMKTPSKDRKSRNTISREEVLACKKQDGHTLSISCHIPTEKANPHHKERRHSSAAPLQSDAEDNRSSDDLTDRAYVSEPEPEPESESDTESVYDVPRPVILDTSGSQDSAAEQEETSESDDSSSSGNDVYEDMQSIVRAINSPQKPPRTPNLPPIGRYTNQGSRLKKAQILRMMYESQSDRDQVSIRVSVPTDHLQKYLGLEEIGEQLRVSKWKGPALIGCVFHHGDVIQSMNDLRTDSEDLFFQMLRLSISSEVNLVLTRDKKAPVFHQEGCACDRS
ncbi:pleckstrin homology domain-containing family S member 1 isoform X3 [Ranitomeya variabilis]|uniref:pleckstrin homology domain-containing family S member 1 isoform X3 n=1 Tax=Ranitomeya variabilis TaxID=490064 RepID=UPI0040563D88